MTAKLHFGYVLVLLCCIPNIALSTPRDINQLWTEYNIEKTSARQAAVLLELAELYLQKQEIPESDSVILMAVESAQMSGNDTLAMRAYKYFFLSGNKFRDIKRANEYQADMLSIAQHYQDNEWLYLSYATGAAILLENNKLDTALQNVNKAFYYAGFTGNDTIMADCFLLWGKCLEQTNNKIDAFRNYLNALYLAQKHRNTEQVYEAYAHLSFFYLLIGKYREAKDYKIKQFALLSQLPQGKDSVQIMRLLNQLANSYYYNNDRVHAENITRRIVKYAYRHNNKELLNEALYYQRAYLMQNGYFKDLAIAYTGTYAKELETLAKEDTLSYYRIMAYISEVDSNKKAALDYFQKAENLVLRDRSTEYHYVSTFMKRYAQFLLRTGNANEAIQKMQLSYNAALKANYLPYLIETTEYLDSLYYTEKDILHAYQYASLNKHYTTEQQSVTKQDAMLLMEIENETRQHELLAKQEHDEVERRHDLQYMGIIIGIICTFIILLMIGSFKVPRVFIKSLGFFSFIFLFEFIILIADNKIIEITHHEPWKTLGIKIVIITFLLPLHHWLEHSLIHYLMEHKMIDTSRISFRKFFYKRVPIPPKPDVIEKN